jgi:hypothetical protein
VNSRRKGHNWERDIATALRRIFGEDRVRRGRQAEGAAEPDVVIDGAPWWIEAKCGGPAAKPLAALCQAEDDSAKRLEARWCVALCKQDRRPATATMRLDTLLRIVELTGVALGRATVTVGIDDWLRIAEAVEGAGLGSKHRREWA